MVRTNLYFKVVVEHDRGDKPEKLGQEIANRIGKLYAVRAVELTAVTPVED